MGHSRFPQKGVATKVATSLAKGVATLVAPPLFLLHHETVRTVLYALQKKSADKLCPMPSTPVLLDRATIRHNLTEFKVRWLAHIEEWKAGNRPATESSHDQ